VSLSRVEMACDEIPPALEGYHSGPNWYVEDDSSSFLSQTAAPSVYVSTCSPVRRQSFNDSCPPESDPHTPLSRTPLRRAPSPLEEAPTPSLDAHSPIPFPAPSPRHQQGTPTPVHRTPNHQQSVPMSVASDLRQSIHRLREQTKRLAQDIEAAGSKPVRRAEIPPVASYYSDHPCMYEGAVHTPSPHSPKRGGTLQPKTASPSVHNASPSGMDLLRLQHASLCKELQTIQQTIVECDQYAAKYHLHALDLERSWSEEEARLERRQEDLIGQLVERGLPIPSLRYAADEQPGTQ
jgi:hypothetical protein